MILPHVPVASMPRKAILLVYKDPEIQQRWISEMKKALPLFLKCINQ
jgi:hypothetical protein